jgi:hypothetical protein
VNAKGASILTRELVQIELYLAAIIVVRITTSLASTLMWFEARDLLQNKVAVETRKSSQVCRSFENIL